MIYKYLKSCKKNLKYFNRFCYPRLPPLNSINSASEGGRKSFFYIWYYALMKFDQVKFDINPICRSKVTQIFHKKFLILSAIYRFSVFFFSNIIFCFIFELNLVFEISHLFFEFNWVLEILIFFFFGKFKRLRRILQNIPRKN